VKEAEHLLTEFFNNAYFKAKIEADNPEKAKVFDKLKQLASDIDVLTAEERFDYEKTKDLMERLNALLCNPHGITVMEFTRSDLLQKLNLFLTCGPN
jgi:hypothetical protein